MSVNGKTGILVVEDDASIRNLITTTLELKNYDFHVAENGRRAIEEAVLYQPDVILLDLGLPDMDGAEVIRKIRTWSVTPIIVISARSDDSDKIKALDLGADDYLTKPFNVEELLARLRSTIRRALYTDTEHTPGNPVFVNGGLEIDYNCASVKVDQTEIHLMPIEYNLLCLLARNVGKVLTHQYIMDKVWVNAIESDMSSLRVYMASLRKKIEKNNKGKYIQTHISIGYRMVKVENEDKKEGEG